MINFKNIEELENFWEEKFNGEFIEAAEFCSDFGEFENIDSCKEEDVLIKKELSSFVEAKILFGKFNGLTLIEIAKQDFDYIEWLMSKSFIGSDGEAVLIYFLKFKYN